MNALNVLILDDEKPIADKIANYLLNHGYTARAVYLPSQALKLIKREKIDVLISDVLLPEMTGLELLKEIKENYKSVEVILISGHGDMDMVIKAMQIGAVDFIKKPFSFVDIQLAIERTGKYLKLQNQLQIAENRNSLITLDLETRIEKNLIGKSREIRNVLDMALKAGRDRNASILITGENGTGKEIIARLIHHASSRNGQVFFPVNCSAIPDTLIESEFFGHQKGAFTDAREDKKGYFEKADGGSLFLDEIADMPHRLQAKLLRALEEKSTKPVGKSKEINVDVRIISASNQNILEQIRKKKFRMDLYHRINTVKIDIPPLRERMEDIEPLLEYFIVSFAREKNIMIPKIENDVIDLLHTYNYPGNVRELKNMVERALIVAKNNIITANDFIIPQDTNKEFSNLNLEYNEFILVKEALRQTNYNQKKAAKLLGISRDALIRRMRKYDIRINKNLSMDDDI